MNYNNPSEIDRIKHLINFGVNESQQKTSSNAPVVDYKVKAADGKTYGIVNEGNKFYIKVAPKKDTEVLNEDFNYIGGENNRKEYEYHSYNMASKQLELKLMSINEAYNENRIAIQQPKHEQPDWQVNETKEMRGAIERFKQLSNNVGYILAEDKTKFTLDHTLPEAPATNPSDKESNQPFTDTAVAKGDKEFTTTTTNHEKVGPFKEDGKSSLKNMQSDKMPGKGNSDETYGDSAKYVPDNSVADKKPNGGKVVRVNEGKRIVKLTEAQVLAWNKSKDYMDKSQGTEIGDSAPFDEDVDADFSSIHESEEVMFNSDDQNKPKPGSGDMGDKDPYTEKITEDAIPVEDAAGMPDEDSDLPFPDVAPGGAYLDFEQEYNDWEDQYGDEFDFDDVDAEKYARQDMSGEFDFDDDFEETYESQNRKGEVIYEVELRDFGQHPAYLKAPMTLPPNKEVAKDGYRDWNDDSAKGEEPYGKQIGDTAPFTEKVVHQIADSIMKQMGFTKKA